MSNSEEKKNFIVECTRRLSKEYRRARGIANPGDLIRKFSSPSALDAFLDREQSYINDVLSSILKEG